MVLLLAVAVVLVDGVVYSSGSDDVIEYGLIVLSGFRLAFCLEGGRPKGLCV